MSAMERVQDLPLEEVLGDRFGRYSKYIIQERALPDARDGLKPVQRRILYAMHTDGNTADKAFRKSAKTVGNVIGNYHPHGDTSVYEAMVRMSQDWKMRNILIEMHGNNGSIDGDPAAAMRYTEARLSELSAELLRDIEKRTVEFVPNFDDTSSEPTVLPARFPNLLVNGSTGISAGYATDIPPHHLGEVIDAVIMRIEKPGCTVDDIMTAIQGPDFPTGGIIQGVEGIKKAYETGKGRIVIRGKTDIQTIRGGRKQIVITEIPYDVNKANLVKRIDEFRIDRKLEGIAEVRDDTDRTGLRIVVELKKEADAEGILNYLFKNSDLQVTYNFNMVAIEDQRPKLMGILDLLDSYIRHQKDVVTKRSRHDLEKALERQHIVEGLIKALGILDEVISTIRASKDKRDAKDNLIVQYGFSEKQAEAIVSLQLYRLTNTDMAALKKEADELGETIRKLEEILNSEKKLLGVIKKELKAVKKKYADERRTVIEHEIEDIKINMEVMIPNEDVIVTVTKEGYAKRTSIRSYSASNGKDLAMKELDRLLLQEQLNTGDTVLLFTDKGNFLYMPVHELPDIRWKDLGQHISGMIPIDQDEKIIQAIPVKDFAEDKFLVFFTKFGMVKKSPLSLYKPQRYSRPLTAVNLREKDAVINVRLSEGSDDILIVTRLGYGILYAETEVNPIGARALGVKGIDLKDGDEVAGAEIISEGANPSVVMITNRGAAKKIKLTEFERSSRARRGSVLLRELKNNPHRVIGLSILYDERPIHVLTDRNHIVKLDPSALKFHDRHSNGTFFMDEKANGSAIELWKDPDPA
jgi:topoisomerase-4 subunit A